MSLYPTFETPLKEAEESGVAEFPEGPAFDYEAGDLKVDAKGRVAMASGYENWMNWCMKAARTERDRLLGYGPGYGTELARALGHAGRGAREELIRQTITAALMADPLGRTGAVDQFAFEWPEDGVAFRFRLTAADGYTGEMTVNL